MKVSFIYICFIYYMFYILQTHSFNRYMLLTGGIETVTKERRWAKIANKLGYPSGRSVGSILKNHYERILYPFDVFKQGKTLSDIVSQSFTCRKKIYLQKQIVKSIIYNLII